MAKISTRAPATKVGDKLYHKLAWDRCWTERKITGETRDYWLIDKTRINKKTLQEKQGGYSPIWWYTKKGMEDYIWLAKNATNIGSCVMNSRDVDLLKKIAEMIGAKVIK